MNCSGLFCSQTDFSRKSSSSSFTPTEPSSGYFIQSMIGVRKLSNELAPGQERHHLNMAASVSDHDIEISKANKISGDPSNTTNAAKSVKSLSINALKKGMKFGKNTTATAAASTNTSAVKVSMCLRYVSKCKVFCIRIFFRACLTYLTCV